MAQALAHALTPWGMTPPRTVRDTDALIDRFVALKEKNPTNTRIDAVLRAIGVHLCDMEAVAIH